MRTSQKRVREKRAKVVMGVWCVISNRPLGRCGAAHPWAAPWLGSYRMLNRVFERRQKVIRLRALARAMTPRWHCSENSPARINPRS
jgi:hypothetical protein